MSPARRELPAASVILTLDSPALAIGPPNVLHRELTPGAVGYPCEVLWNSGVLPARPIRFARLQEVYVAKEGLVFDGDGQLFACTVTQHTEGEIAEGAAAVEGALGQLPHRAGPHVLCKKRGTGNYGHWLIEMLPKMFLAGRHLGLPELRHVVPAESGAMAAVIGNSADRIGVDATRRLALGEAPAFFDELVVVDGLTSHGWYLSPLLVPCLDALAASVPAGRAARILVIRSTHRMIANWDAVRRAAGTAGYAVVDPGRLSLAQQIAVFKGAREIVGIMGAGMTNIAFAPAGARVTVLAPATMPDTFYWMIAGLREHHYTEVRCRQSGPRRGLMPYDTDIIIDPADLPHLFGDRSS